MCNLFPTGRTCCSHEENKPVSSHSSLFWSFFVAHPIVKIGFQRSLNLAISNLNKKNFGRWRYLYCMRALGYRTGV